MSFMEIFQPGLKHLREEQYRRQMDVAYPTNGGNPPMDIDLDAGTATIVVRVPIPEQVEEPVDEPGSVEGWPTSRSTTSRWDPTRATVRSRSPNAAPPPNPRAPWH